VRVTVAPDVAGLGQPVHQAGDGPGGQAGVLPDRARRHRPQPPEHVDALALDRAEPEQPADGLVEHHDRGGELAAEQLGHRRIRGSCVLRHARNLPYSPIILQAKLISD